MTTNEQQADALSQLARFAALAGVVHAGWPEAAQAGAKALREVTELRGQRVSDAIHIQTLKHERSLLEALKARVRTAALLGDLAAVRLALDLYDDEAAKPRAGDA